MISGPFPAVRRVPLLATALLSAVALAGGAAQAQAAPHPGVVPATPGVISTVAGGPGGPAPATEVPMETSGEGVAYGNGALYIASGPVRQVSPSTDRLTTPAGTGVTGPVGDGGPATVASLFSSGATLDSHGNLIIGDTQFGTPSNVSSGRVRVVAASTGTFYGQAMTAGHIYTVAGGGSVFNTRTGVPALTAGLARPQFVAVDHHGNLIISDPGYTSSEGAQLQVVAASSGTFYHRAMTAGYIYTLAGFPSPAGLHFSGDGGPAIKASLGSFIGAAATDPAGNLLLADTIWNRVRVIAARTGTFYGQAMRTGDIYTVAGNGNSGFNGDGGPATSASLTQPQGVTVDGAGNLVIADSQNSRIRVVAASTGTFYGQAMSAGDIYTVAGDGTYGFSGDGGPATAAELEYPSTVAVDTAGDLLIGDSSGHVRLVAAGAGTFYGQAMTAGDIYTVAGNGTNGNGPLGLTCCIPGPATAALLAEPSTVAVDRSGNWLIAEGDEIQVVAKSTGTFYRQAMTAGNIYTVATATMLASQEPGGVAADAAGNLVFSDPQANQVGVLAESTGTFYGIAMTAGNIYTLAGTGSPGRLGNGGPGTAAELSSPLAVTVDSAGNVLIADSRSNQIRVVAASTGTFYGQAMRTGYIYGVAGSQHYGYSGDGGPARRADIAVPEGVALDAAGNVVIADTDNQRIRVAAVKTGTFYGIAMTAGDIYTVAGNSGTCGFGGDGGPALQARFCYPVSVAVDSAGNVATSDFYNDRVRLVAASTGTFYGQAMTAGDIYTVAGNGTTGYSGDGGPAAAAEFNFLGGMAADGAGNLLIADEHNNRIRQVAG